MMQAQHIVKVRNSGSESDPDYRPVTCGKDVKTSRRPQTVCKTSGGELMEGQCSVYKTSVGLTTQIIDEILFQKLVFRFYFDD